MLDEQLAQWLRAVELTPGTVRQSAIAAAAKSVASKATWDSVIGYAMLATGYADDEAFEDLRAAVFAIDQTFGCRIDDLETRISAAICLAEMMERNAIVAVYAAQAILSAEWSGADFPVSELPHLARTTLEQRSESYRARGLLDAAITLTPLPQFPEDANPLTHQEAQTLSVATAEMLELTRKTLALFAKRVDLRITSSDEELDILWWAFSGYCESEGTPWSSVRNEGASAILMALELAKFIRFPVEPSSTTAILARLLGRRSDNLVTTSAAISSAAKRTFTGALPSSHHLFPIFTCLGEYKAVNGKDGWMDSVGRWSIDPSRSISCLSLATQTLRELMLNKGAS